MIHVTLPSDRPDNLQRSFQQLTGVAVRDGTRFSIGPSSLIRDFLELITPDDLLDQPDRLRVHPVVAKRLRARGVAPLVFGPRLALELRRRLGEQGINYLDSQGHAQVTTPHIALVHEEPALRPRATTTDKLGPVAMRIIQVLIDRRPERGAWTTTALAELAHASVGQAHNVFAVLEQEGLVRAEGSRNRRERTVDDRAALLDWAAERPSIRRPTEPTVNAYVGARDLEGLALKVSGAARSSHRIAFSGAAAAALMGHPVVSSVPQAIVRVRLEAPEDLVGAAEQLNMTVTSTAPNVLLVRDTGHVGTELRSLLPNDVPIAPASRVYLDLFREGRGDDGAALFRSTVVGEE